jgi:hypothetical protein
MAVAATDLRASRLVEERQRGIYQNSSSGARGPRDLDRIAVLGDCRKMIYQDALDLRSYSRRASRRIRVNLPYKQTIRQSNRYSQFWTFGCG